MRATLADSPAKPVVVWHLCRTPDQEVWCVVTKVDHRFALAVSIDDPEEPTCPMAERYTDIASLIPRADQVKREFLAGGGVNPNCTNTTQRPTVASL